MDGLIKDNPLYRAYLIPRGKMVDSLSEIFAKAITLFLNEGYEIIGTHELEKQEVTIIIFRLRDEND